jgi:hypothetical protein
MLRIRFYLYLRSWRLTLSIINHCLAGIAFSALSPRLTLNTAPYGFSCLRAPRLRALREAAGDYLRGSSGVCGSG